MMRFVALLRLHVAHAQIVEQVLEQLGFRRGEVAARSSPAACR